MNQSIPWTGAIFVACNLILVEDKRFSTNNHSKQNEVNAIDCYMANKGMIAKWNSVAFLRRLLADD